MIKAIFLAALLIITLAYTEQNHVLALTDEDLPAVTQEFSHILVEFYAPWCGHCKKLSPVYDEVAKELHQQGSPVRLAKIDADAYSSVKSTYGVQGFPTIFFFLNGQKIKYEGQRTKEFMVNWLSKKTRDPVITLEADKLDSLADGKVNVVFYGDLSSQEGQAFSQIAVADDYNTYYNVKESSEAAGTVQIHRSFGDAVSTQDHSNLKSWIALYDRPVVYAFDDRTIGDVFHKGNQAIVLFQNAAAGQVLNQAFKDAAEEWRVNKGKSLIFTELPVSAEHYGGLANYIKIDFNKSPIVVINGGSRTKNVLSVNPSELDSDQIIGFLDSVENGAAKSYGLDEQVVVEETVEEEL